MSEATTFNPSYVTARPDVLALAPEDATRVLDVGCAAGALGAAIKQQRPGCRVTGVEYSPDMAAEAEKALDRVHQADLNRQRLADLIADEQFDLVIFADVLEHLADPWSVLADAVARLVPEGRVITSLPNIRHMSTFWHLFVRGEWPLRNRGIYDRTHLRWFTRFNILEMFRHAGLEVETEKRNLRFSDGRSPFMRFNKYARIMDLPILRGFYTHQYLHVTKKKQDGGPGRIE